jgi:hypothetical protein
MGAQLDVDLTDEWLEAHPLTAADMVAESLRLQHISINLV